MRTPKQSNKPNQRTKMRGKQGRKDSDTKRVNFDNESESKFDREYVKRGRTKCEGDRSNDVSWYSKNPTLLDAAGRIGFSQVTGTPDGNGITVPGIMVIPWASSLGGSETNAVNQAKDDIYSFTVHANSRNTTYTSADQMMLILGAKEAFNGIAVLIRVFGVMLKNNAINNYIPRAVVEGSGLSYDDCLNNFHRMQYDINLLITRSRELWIPNTMPVFVREFWMCSHVYFDNKSPKGQLYMYTPQFIRQYDELTGGGATLAPTTWFNQSSLMTWQAAVDLVAQTIELLIQSEDRGIICGDLLKAYGAEKMFTINFVDNNYNVNPVYDEEVLTQISNVTGVNASTAWRTSFIQDPVANVIQEGTAETTALTPVVGDCLADTPMLNMHTEGQPTSEQIMVATRMMAAGTHALKNSSNNIVALMPRYCGTEIAFTPVVGYYVWTSGRPVLNWRSVNLLTTTLTGSSANLIGWIDVYRLLMQFDWAPIHYWVGGTPPTTSNPNGSIKPTAYFGDVDNYAIVNEELGRLHKTAVYSEFGVPIL